MRVPTHENRIITLVHFIYSYDDYNLLLVIQQKHPNLLLEIMSDDPSKKLFVPAHVLDLEHFSTLTLYNSSYQ